MHVRYSQHLGSVLRQSMWLRSAVAANLVFGRERRAMVGAIALPEVSRRWSRPGAKLGG